MVELAIRLLAAASMVLLAGMLGWENFDTVWKASGFACFYAFCIYAIELKGHKNSGTSGIAACFDACVIAAVLGSAGSIPSFGFIVLAPLAYAAAKYGSMPSAMAPIAAFALMGADQWANNGAQPSNIVMGHALGVLAVGMLLNHRRIVVTVAEPLFSGSNVANETNDPSAHLELRESFRTLKDRYHELERKSRRDRHAADLRLALAGDAVRFPKRLAQQLKKISNADGLSLYTLADSAGNLSVRAAEGSVTEAMRQSSLFIGVGEAIDAIRRSSERALHALASAEEKSMLRNVVLTHCGRVVGLVSLRCDERTRMEESARIVEDLASIIAEMIHESGLKSVFEGRLRRAELLYEITTSIAGATSQNSLAARTVEQLSEILDLEQFSITWLDGEVATLAAAHGASASPFQAMSFAKGDGLGGWLSIGTPELIAFDVADDSRCRHAEMSKLRIQSFAIMPIGIADETTGFLCASSPRSMAVDAFAVEALRLVAAELFQAIQRLGKEEAEASGLMLPGEFHRRISKAKRGSLVYLEPVRKEELISRHGAPAFDLALRQLAHRLRSRLPNGGAICKRAEGDYIVYLTGSEKSARSWAAEATATASLIGIPVEENGKRVPLAIRAKVARVGTQEPENVLSDVA